MTETGFMKRVSGEWDHSHGSVRLRIDADQPGQPQQLCIKAKDIDGLISLLLALCSKAAPPPQEALENRTIRPFAANSVLLGSTDDGDIVLEMRVGPTSLAFMIPADMCLELGQTLLTLAAAKTQTAN